MENEATKVEKKVFDRLEDSFGGFFGYDYSVKMLYVGSIIISSKCGVITKTAIEKVIAVCNEFDNKEGIRVFPVIDNGKFVVVIK